jgi:hypothetical protein
MCTVQKVTSVYIALSVGKQFHTCIFSLSLLVHFSSSSCLYELLTGRLVLAYGPICLGPSCPRAELSGIPFSTHVQMYIRWLGKRLFSDIRL